MSNLNLDLDLEKSLYFFTATDFCLIKYNFTILLTPTLLDNITIDKHLLSTVENFGGFSDYDNFRKCLAELLLTYEFFTHKYGIATGKPKNKSLLLHLTNQFLLLLEQDISADVKTLLLKVFNNIQKYEKHLGNYSDEIKIYSNVEFSKDLLGALLYTQFLNTIFP
jgi:hypothetical protein